MFQIFISAIYIVGAYCTAGDDTDVTGTLTLGLFRNPLSPFAASRADHTS